MNEVLTVNKGFDDFYIHSEASALGKIIFNMVENQTLNSIENKGISKRAKIIDIGCGVGRTLKLFRARGFLNSIGIDSSETALKACSSIGFVIGKDVRVSNAKNTKFKSNSFDLVFAEGLLEHFKNFTPFVKEMCRISKNYIVLIQPNKFSLAHRLMDKIANDMNVEEIPYKIEEFQKAFNSFGFDLVKTENSFLNIFWVLIFKKSEKFKKL